MRQQQLVIRREQRESAVAAAKYRAGGDALEMHIMGCTDVKMGRDAHMQWLFILRSIYCGLTGVTKTEQEIREEK